MRRHGSSLLNEIRYYRPSAQLGARLAGAVEQVVQLAAQYPETDRHTSTVRAVSFQKFPFSIVVYVAQESEVYIVAIAPFRRKPGYWQARAR
jgi:toxin ParE1/3/4